MLGIGNIILNLRKDEREDRKLPSDTELTEATISKTLSEASAKITGQYIELLDRVKKDFDLKLLEISNKLNTVEEELEAERNRGIVKDQIISRLEDENKKLNRKIEALKAELEAWKLTSGI